MSIKNCKTCGKIFNSMLANEKICPLCKQHDSENFKKVRNYLYKNKGATIPTVSSETNVSAKDIIRYLREDRLEVSDTTELGIPCEKCNTTIKSGRFCPNCINEMESMLKDSVKSENTISNPTFQTTKTNKMFTANLRRNK